MVNLSATGVLVQVAEPAALGANVTVIIPWQTQALHLSGRIVRCNPHYTDADDRVLWRDPDSYRVAIEFLQNDSDSANSLQRVLRQAAARQDTD